MAVPVTGPIVPAAVLVALVQRAGLCGAPGVLLTRRADHLSRHAGQVSFPGGRIDPDDASPEAAALREAQEEVGLDPALVRLDGRLPEHLTGTGYRVVPGTGPCRHPADAEARSARGDRGVSPAGVRPAGPRRPGPPRRPRHAAHHLDLASRGARYLGRDGDDPPRARPSPPRRGRLMLRWAEVALFWRRRAFWFLPGRSPARQAAPASHESRCRGGLFSARSPPSRWSPGRSCISV